MRDAKLECLGFSDLTEDEGFIIVLFRDWQCRGPTRAIAEHAIARLLYHDKIYPYLGVVFHAFGAMDQSVGPGGDRGALLSETEESLLTRLSVALRNTDQPCGTTNSIDVRPAFIIHRSGHDRLLGHIERSYWRAAAMLAVPKGRLN